MPPISIGTAYTARLFIATALTASSPTAIAAPNTPEQQERPASVATTRSLISGVNSKATTVIVDGSYKDIARPTTQHEKLIGELRELSLLNANWDGEGAAVPSILSIKEAVSFVRLLNGIALPEPMLLASGHTSLYWNEGDIYADIEFLDDGRIAYFIKTHGDKHKGVLAFDSQKMPAVFQTLLQA